MPVRRLIVSAHNGVHARPVAELVRLAQSHDAPVTLRTADGTTVDLTSVLAVMDLGIASGDSVVIETAPSATAEAVLDQLAEVLAPRG
ncbi:HPr family phosphocarrier protein [Microbacterium sp.]|uniref:HPr family phosphocarrier protein n=1 Tax=Microbacterium sp. TaxID=51671 RepID=UPI00261884A0|nr:HPr family phosphocarrier protein [Microbacterium sp.]MCV0335626.1 HPr family phosphocarrier protein [Microbacterium sp.]MCV0376884.1 HPr family phosphocarrier protein [Microbacterium sp.]MCV0390644.1 HPr family phosphocarrier protein [Microbacterium sp.]MCV0418379.1 HPr family phosphocarrier protein [Microbacterium sp.]MCV0421953.1 HPr family phosphocarrier protein [Microbacterium sp.]